MSDNIITRWRRYACGYEEEEKMKEVDRVTGKPWNNRNQNVETMILRATL